MTHILKCWPDYFEAVQSGKKTFELRKNDRNFQADDCILLLEYEPDLQVYTGRSIERRISYIVREGPWLTPGYVALSLQEVV